MDYLHQIFLNLMVPARLLKVIGLLLKLHLFLLFL